MQQFVQRQLLIYKGLQCSLKELKRLELGQAVRGLPLDRHKQIHGRKKLTIQYHGNVNLLFHSAMANRHGDRIRFSVLLAEEYAHLLIEDANLQGQKPSSLIRDLVYQYIQSQHYNATLASTADTIISDIQKLETH